MALRRAILHFGAGREQWGPSEPTTTNTMNLTSSQLTKLGTALGICYAIYKFVGHPAIKAAALGVAGTIIAKQLPYVSDALA